MNWADFAAYAPELAALALEAFEEQHLAILGTLRADGWPRISPCEVYFVDGELLLGMMPDSRKVTDLARDNRITVATPQAEQTPKHGDSKLYGRAIAVTDAGVRERFADAQEAAIEWRPPSDIPLFALDIDSAAYISFGEGRRALRWTASEGEVAMHHPEDDEVTSEDSS